jgi:1-acyl-sn-glycerol-3-phosphate acyltransferase
MLRLVSILVAVAAVTVPLMPVQWAAVALKRPLRRRIPVFYHRVMCALLGVRVRVIGKPMHAHPLLIVANHASWLDISVITSAAPVVFVAKREIASWPFFGLLAKLQRSVFVDRERRAKTGEVNAEIAQRLAEGDPVVLFGEGTSSDGNRVLPFRTALIGAARDALAAAEHVQQVWIQPLSLAYVNFQGLPMGRQRRPLAAWYGDMDLVPHLSGVCKRGAFDVVLTWGEPVAYSGETDRKALAKQLESSVRDLTVAALRGRAAEPGPAGRSVPFSPESRYDGASAGPVVASN